MRRASRSDSTCAIAAFLVFVASSAAPADPPVQVVVDMDASTPGIQPSVSVPAGSGGVEDIAVYVIDPLGTRQMWAIGYLGGLDRGIAFGHTPDADNVGLVTEINGVAHTPVHPEGTGWVDHPPLFEPAFAGPEVQYLEFGTSGPATIAAAPAGPVFTVDVTLDGAVAGDRFTFFLLDVTSVWIGDGNSGAFSTGGPFTLDTGGDVVPDGTSTLYGLDPDTSAPVPPAAFAVDYVDGPTSGGGATIVIVAPADVNGDGLVDVNDLLQLLGAWGPCAPPCPEDLNGDGTVGVDDLLALLAAWSAPD